MAEAQYQCVACRKIMTDVKPGVVMCLSCNCIQPTENAQPPIPLKCTCGAQFQASKSLLNKRFACNKCGSPVTIK